MRTYVLHRTHWESEGAGEYVSNIKGSAANEVYAKKERDRPQMKYMPRRKEIDSNQIAALNG